MNANVHKVTDGCLAWLRLPGTWGETNIGLVVGHRASLLIDTPWDARLTRAMLDAFAPHTDAAPISMLLNTHADPDHWWGNSVVADAEVVASEACARAMHSEAPPKRLLAQRRLARLGGRLPGRLGATGRYVSSMLAPFSFEDVTLRFPDRTFTDQRTETIGGREVQFIDYGAAHTASDSVVFVPDARVVYTGDLLFSAVTPVMWHGPVEGWLHALEAILALDADLFVPGHGPVSTRTELSALRTYWTWLCDAVESHESAGRDALETAKLLSGRPEFAAFRPWESAERLYINVETISRQRAGQGPIPNDPLSRAKAFDGIACLCRHLEKAR